MIDRQARPTWSPIDYSDDRAPAREHATRGTGGRPRRATSSFMVVLLALMFGAVQLWAIMVVLVLLKTDGVAQVALFCVLVGSATAVCLGFREIHAISVRERATETGADRSDRGYMVR